MSFPVQFSSGTEFGVQFASAEELKPVFSPVIVVHDADYFDGDYAYMPAQEAQTIPIRGKTGRDDIIIHPIPQNYGLITWNGAVLTVS